MLDAMPKIYNSSKVVVSLSDQEEYELTNIVVSSKKGLRYFCAKTQGDNLEKILQEIIRHLGICS